jgi:hypothetical protein
MSDELFELILAGAIVAVLLWIVWWKGKSE